MRLFRTNHFLPLLFCGLCGLCEAALAEGRPMVGWLEKVKLYPDQFVLNAKMDTGADYSSLSATDLEQFEREGQKWVRFSVFDRAGKKHPLEKRVVRTAYIKQKGGDTQKRSVIRLVICVGGTYMEADVNMIDRSQYKQAMLVGRNFLAGNVMVDPASSYTSEPNCKGVPEN